MVSITLKVATSQNDPQRVPLGATRGRSIFYLMKIEGSKPAIYEWVKKLWLGGLKGGPKDFQKDAKKNWIRLFYDPPGPIKLFLHSFSAWARRVCEHSDFFLKHSIWQNIFKSYGKAVKSLGQSQIWWKTKSTNFGHFQTWKVHFFEDVFIAMKVSRNLKLRFLKLEMTLGSNFRFEKDGASKEGVFTTIFEAKIEKNWVFHFFQYFIVNYHKRIHFYIFSTLFVISSKVFGHKTRKFVNMSFFLLTIKYSSINYQNVQDITK